MLITLDNLAHRYHCLPSEALARASTFDLKVLDTSTKWHNYKAEQADRREGSSNKPPESYSQEQLMSILKQVK
jgi:hypothetical protein